jgi:hypothetical protein
VVETELTSVPSPESEPAAALKKFKALKKKKKKRKKNAVLKLKPRLVGISKKAKKNNKKLRKVAEKEIKEHRDREEKLAKLKQLEMQEPIDVKPVIVDISVEQPDEKTPSPLPSMAQHIFKTNIENTIDMVARGYFSEPELAAGCGAGGSMQPRVLKKLKSQEKPRSKSLTKKEKPAELVDETGNGETDSAKATATAPPKEQQAQKSKRSKSKSREEDEEEETHNLVNINNNTIKVVAETDEAKAAKKAKATKTKKKSKDVEKPVESTVGEEDASNNNTEAAVEEKIVQTIGAHIAQLATAMAESKQACTESDEAEQRPTKVPAARKRSKSRSSKFSSRKRHRASMTAEVDPPVVVPRKAHSAPRWSNGWSWEGQSFQGKVFLNVSSFGLARKF